MKPIPRNELKVGMIVLHIDSNERYRIEKIEDDCIWAFSITTKDIWCFLKKEFTKLFLVEETREEITWENLKAGDYLQHSDGSRVKVLAVLGDCFLSSETRNHDSAASWVTKKQIDKESWSIIQPTKPIREVTQQEVNEKFGEEVRINN